MAAWLQSDTIRNNILFGSAYDEQRFEQTLHACALLPDLAMFADREFTEVCACDAERVQTKSDMLARLVNVE